MANDKSNEKLLNGLKLGDNVWIPEKRPVFPKVNFGSDKNVLIEELHKWPDGEVTSTSLLEGKGPEYWTPMRYEFAGCWKSDHSWRKFWTFTPLGGANWEIKFCVNEVWNDLTGKNNSRPADIFRLLDYRRQIKRCQVFESKEECESWCKTENKKINITALAAGLRKMQRAVKDFSKKLEAQ